ncbi:hypothetical protein B1B05_16340 [Domibacillus enclensis]|uniref:Secreted protein n=1 Tax=Domibacillus enclensis TaxID=1017273 RepID=A0ABX4E559_9BACI|nr:hypothetical protein B1B05_16340 [Domibacillus enclensis]
MSLLLSRFWQMLVLPTQGGWRRTKTLEGSAGQVRSTFGAKRQKLAHRPPLRTRSPAEAAQTMFAQAQSLNDLPLKRGQKKAERCDRSAFSFTQNLLSQVLVDVGRKLR